MTAEYGDLVLVYEGKHNLIATTLVKGGAIHRGAVFNHDDIVGRPYGSRIAARGRGADRHITILHPTPELWTAALKFRTQILYTMDISQIIFNLRINAGSVVIESGETASHTTSWLLFTKPIELCRYRVGFIDDVLGASCCSSWTCSYLRVQSKSCHDR